MERTCNMDKGQERESARGGGWRESGDSHQADGKSVELAAGVNEPQSKRGCKELLDRRAKRSV